jgi:hypothetical protein
MADHDVDVSGFVDLFQNNLELEMGFRIRATQDPLSDLGIIDGDATLSLLHLHMEGVEDLF